MSVWTIGNTFASVAAVFAMYASAPVGSVPKVPIYNGSSAAYLRVKPGVITYTGDNTGYLAGRGRASHRPKRGRLHWREWTSTHATATGADWGDDCLPSCATGLRTPFPVRVKLYRPRLEGGYDVFTRMRVTYTGARPPLASKRSYAMRVTYRPPDSWMWAGGLIA